jgi:hypothetical protein
MHYICNIQIIVWSKFIHNSNKPEPQFVRPTKKHGPKFVFYLDFIQKSGRNSLITL